MPSWQKINGSNVPDHEMAFQTFAAFSQQGQSLVAGRRSSVIALTEGPRPALALIRSTAIATSKWEVGKVPL